MWRFIMGVVSANASGVLMLLSITSLMADRAITLASGGLLLGCLVLNVLAVTLVRHGS